MLWLFHLSSGFTARLIRRRRPFSTGLRRVVSRRLSSTMASPAALHRRHIPSPAIRRRPKAAAQPCTGSSAALPLEFSAAGLLCKCVYHVSKWFFFLYVLMYSSYVLPGWFVFDLVGPLQFMLHLLIWLAGRPICVLILGSTCVK